MGIKISGQPRLAGLTASVIIPAPSGEAVYRTTGTFTWVAPADVTSVSVVAVGGAGKAGGGLGWKNNITVVPGNSYTVRVGNRAASTNESAGDSYFINTATVMGRGAGNGAANSTTGGTFVGDGGGNGGGTAAGLAGGGAGGYTGNGGAGKAGYSNVTGNPGSGGGGGSGGVNSNGYAAGCGAVGLYGQGANGEGGTSVNPNCNGKGGSGGDDALPSSNTGRGVGASPGGGGGGGYDSSVTGGYGALRIMWGPGRSFPLNAA